MSSLLQAILPCLPIKRGIHLPAETAKSQQLLKNATLQSWPLGDEKSTIRNDEAALSIVSAMSDADKNGPSLRATIQSLVHTAGGWSEYLAKKVVAALEAVLKAGEPLNAAMQEAYDKAYEALRMTEGFAADHPAVFWTVLALGLLVVLAPYAVEWLGFCAGFGELGPIEGSWAALWQSRYMGLVPKGSLFSYFQRLGMTYKRV